MVLSLALVRGPDWSKVRKGINKVSISSSKGLIGGGLEKAFEHVLATLAEGILHSYE